MARVIGFVKSLQDGVFFAKDAQGAIRELKAGDQVFQNELIYGAPNNPQDARIIVDVTLTDAKDITVFGATQLYVDLSAIGGAFEKEEAIASEDSLQNAWQLSTNTPNPDGQVDAPAAGLEETAAGEGLTDTERAGGSIFDARTGLIGDVSTNLSDTINGGLNPNLVGPDTLNLNDQPVVYDVVGEVNESLDGLNIISGQLVATDPDVDDTHTFFAVEGSLLLNGAPAPEGLVFVLNPDGTYSVSGDFNALAIDENAVITFQYYAVDNGIDVGAPHASLPATVTITVNGTNDQPVIEDINVNGGETSNTEYATIEVIEGSREGYSQDTTIGQWFFTHNGGPISIDILTEFNQNIWNTNAAGPNDINNSGSTEAFDAYIQIFRIEPNGSYTFIASVDDSSSTYGDGSVHPYDSYYSSASLASGNYMLAVGQLSFSQSEAIEGINYESGFSGNGYTGYGPYKVTFTGDLVVTKAPISSNVIYETRDATDVVGVDDTKDDGNNVLTGILFVQDDDTTDTHTFRVVDEHVQILDVSNAGIDLGDVSVSIALVDGVWQYNINGNFTELAAGEQATVSFQYVADDGHGFDGTDGINESSVSAPKTITVIITGTNDQPVISDIVINTSLSFGSDNWFVEGNGLTIVGYENNGSIVTPILHNGGLGIGSGWGEDSQINDQISFGGRSAEAIVFGFEQAFNTATIELTSLNQGTWFNGAEKAEWIAYKDGVEVGRGILVAQAGADIFTISTTSDFNSLKIAPPLDWETDSFYVKSLSVSKTFYESYDATPLDTTSDVTTTFTGKLDVTILDDDTNDIHTYSLDGTPSVNSERVTDLGVVIDAEGNYALTGNFNALATGESATVTFQYHVVDSSSTRTNGESNTSEAKTVTMTITGTNDQPVISDFTVTVSEASLLEVQGKEDYRYVGQLDVSDHDASDTHTFGMLSHSVRITVTTINDGESSTITLNPNKVQISLDENTGEYTVSSSLFNTLGANQSMSVSFDYRASDGNGFDGTDGQNESSLSVARTATLVVNGTNDQPIAYGDTENVWEQELSNVPSEDATFGGRLPNASDEDAISHITYAGVDANNNGQIDVTVVAPLGVDASQTVVTVNANGTYSISNPTFDALAAGERATVTFSYVVDDGSGATDESSQSAPKSVTLTIFGTNDKPVVENVTIEGSEEITGLNTFTGSLHVNDVDASDDNTFAIRSGSISSNNPLVSALSVTLTSEGAYTIIGDFNKLALGESATIRFQYRADDGSGSPLWDESRYSDYKTVTLNVTGTNDAPVFTVGGESYSFNYNENSAAGTLLGTVHATDIDHGSSVSYSIASGNDAGYFAINAITGAITLTEAGAHAFTNDFETLSNSHALVVGASDGIVTTSINVTLNEQNVNDAPDAIDDFGVSGVRAEYYGYHEGVDGINLLNITQIRAFMADNTPDATFSPTLLDYQYGTGDLARGTHLQTFLGADAASLSTDPSDATDGIIHMSGYLNMDAGTYTFKVHSDDGYAILVDGQPVATFDNIQSPATHEHASFTIAASGLHHVEVIYWDQGIEYVFKAEISKEGGAYQVLDMSGGTSSLVTPEDTALTLTAATLLANDTDQDGDTLSITSVQDATHGTVVLNGDGTVTFTPEANYNGDATFTYTINDGNGGSDTATVTLHVTPVNDAPTFASPYIFNYNENSIAGATIGTVQATDIDSASLTYSIVGGNSNGYFAINSLTGAISLSAIGAASLANNYEALANTHNLTVSASDGIVSTSIAVTLNELDVNEVPPVNALNDSVITNAGSSTFLIPEWALLDNDVNANDIIEVHGATSLQAVLKPTGVEVTDNSGGYGGSFVYTVTDGVSNDTAMVNVTRDTHGHLNGTNGNDILIAGNGRDVLEGGAGNDILLAGANNDLLIGGSGSDILKGEAGNDTLIFDSADRIIDGGTGTDTLLFESNGTINFNNIVNGTIKNIEVLDLTEANITITNLSLQDVIDMTEENSNMHMLTIEGGSTDTMNIPTAPAGYSVVHTHSNSQDLDTYTYTSNSGDPTVVIKVDDNIHQV